MLATVSRRAVFSRSIHTLLATVLSVSLTAQVFNGTQSGTADPSTNTTTFNINVTGMPGEQFNLGWESDYGMPSFQTTLTIPASGLLSAAITVGALPGTLDRLRIDGLDGAPVDICDGNWPAPPSPIAISVPFRSSAPVAASLGCNVFEFTGSQVVPPVATMERGVGTVYFDVAGNLKMTIHHNVLNATAVRLHMGPSGANGPVLFTFPSPASPARAATAVAGPFSPATAAAIFSQLYFTIETAAGERLRGQTVASADCDLFIAEFCPAPLATFSVSPGIDTNRDGILDAMDDQFVEIVNGRDVPVDLSGYRIRAGGMVRHVFAPGTRLLPEEAIVVFGGGNLSVFVGAGHRGVTASSGALAFNPVTETIELLTNASPDVVVDSFGYVNDFQFIEGRSRTRSPQNSDGTFVDHANLGPAPHSAGRFVDDNFVYPPNLASTPGNFSDIAIIVRKNGAISSPILHQHVVSPIDLLSLSFISPLGSLTGRPFAAFAQLIPTALIPPPIALPGDSVPTIIFAPFLPVIVILDGLTNPSALFAPVVGTTLVGNIPAALTGMGLTLTLQCAVVDPPINLVGIGTAPPHRFTF